MRITFSYTNGAMSASVTHPTGGFTIPLERMNLFAIQKHLREIAEWLQ